MVPDYNFCCVTDDHQDLSSVNTVTDDGVHTGDFNYFLESEVDSYTCYRCKI